jgi:hypothetical protein
VARRVLRGTCFHVGFLLGVFFDPEDVLPKRRMIFNGLHGLIYQKIVLFITTVVRTSNPTSREYTEFEESFLPFSSEYSVFLSFIENI